MIGFAGVVGCSLGQGDLRPGGSFGAFDGDDGKSFVDPDTTSESGDDPADPSSTSDEPSDPTADPSGGDEGCIGELGCACSDQGECFGELRCEANVCVTPPPPEATCGNALVEEGEECDDGEDNSNAAVCTESCQEARCGDGHVYAGVEACDDGNQVDNDTCTNDCAPSTCGNGQVDPGEDCDDANQSNTDGCLDSCLAAFCGDGFVHAGVEDCDDANQNQGDACLTSCAAASCGDGEVWVGHEGCDDGNQVDGDACPATCQCNAGIVDFDAIGDLAGWTFDGSWGLFTAAGPAPSTPAVGLGGSAFGSDGNRAQPYDMNLRETENSSATSPLSVLPQVLQFRSWSYDEGGTNGGAWDNKRVLVSDDGSNWTTLVDCTAGIDAGQPFCVNWVGQQGSPPASFSDVGIDLGPFGGQTGQIRFEYTTVDDADTWELGWYVDDVNTGACG